MLVHDAQGPVIAALEHVSYAGILEMLFMFSVSCGRELGDLLRVKLKDIGGHGAVHAEDFYVNLANINSHSGSTGEILTLPTQHNQPCRLRSFGISAKDRGDLGVITLPLFRLLFREELPKFADKGLNLSSAEQGL